jgi:hypothetical protein
MNMAWTERAPAMMVRPRRFERRNLFIARGIP